MIAEIKSHLPENLVAKVDWYDPYVSAEDELLKEVDRQSLTFRKNESGGLVIVTLLVKAKETVVDRALAQ